MQVDPIKPKLKPPGTKRLKLNCDIVLSTPAFKFNLRRYIVVEGTLNVFQKNEPGRGLHSFPFQLNLSCSVHRITQLNS